MKNPADSDKYTSLLDRASHFRLWIASALLGILLLLLPHSWRWELRTLLAWDAAVACYLGLALVIILSNDADETKRLSRSEDEHRPIIDAVLIAASFVSLFGVLRALAKAQEIKGSPGLVLTVVAIAAVALSWFLVHTIYAFHYARLYYEGDGEGGGGADFHTDDAPDYLDFCYLAFCVGTTFGATDSEIGGRSIRRTMTKHSILSFTFATVIVSLALSTVSSMISG